MHINLDVISPKEVKFLRIKKFYEYANIKIQNSKAKKNTIETD